MDEQADRRREWRGARVAPSVRPEQPPHETGEPVDEGTRAGAAVQTDYPAARLEAEGQQRDHRPGESPTEDGREDIVDNIGAAVVAQRCTRRYICTSQMTKPLARRLLELIQTLHALHLRSVPGNSVWKYGAVLTDCAAR